MRHRVLIVDDERENLEALKRALGDENSSWEIETAASETDGLSILLQSLADGCPIDVVLTDLVMKSEQSGMTMLQEARKIDPLVMTILFTAKEKSLNRFDALGCGAFDVVEKNIRGTSAVREIMAKTKAAITYRGWATRVTFLRRYFDPAIFEAIEQDQESLELSQRIGTVVFWDIRGFSSLCEHLKAHPTLIAGFLREYCEEASRIVFEHTGVLDKFIGDGVMALFGVLGSCSDDHSVHAKKAVNAALAFRDSFDEIANTWVEKWKLYTPNTINIGLGCGMHTGELLVGNVGTNFRDQFTALGPHVNFASRIESRSQPRQILLSQSTEVRVRDSFKLTKAGSINDIKNIPGEFQLFQVD